MSDASARTGNPLARWAKLALPWILTILIIEYFRRTRNLGAIGNTLAHANWWAYIALMLPYSVAYFLLDSLAVTTVVRRFHAPVRYRDVMPVRAVTYVLALVNSNVGQGGLALWLHRRESIPLLSIAGTFLFLAFVEIYQLVVYSSLGVALGAPGLPGIATAYAVAYVLLLAWLLYFNGARALGIARPVPRVLGTFGRAKLADYAVILAIKSIALGLAIMTHWYGLQLFGMHVPLDALLASLPLIFLGSAVPITAGKMHAPLLWSYFFATIGGYAPKEGLETYSLVAHLTFLLMNAAIGVAFLPRAGREIWELKPEADDHGTGA